jgi:hypothetical protein
MKQNHTPSWPILQHPSLFRRRISGFWRDFWTKSCSFLDWRAVCDTPNCGDSRLSRKQHFHNTQTGYPASAPWNPQTGRPFSEGVRLMSSTEPDQVTRKNLERLSHPAVVAYAVRCALRVWGRIPRELRERNILHKNECHVEEMKSALRLARDYVNAPSASNVEGLRRAVEDLQQIDKVFNAGVFLEPQRTNTAYPPRPTILLRIAVLSPPSLTALRTLLAAVRAASCAAQSQASYGDCSVICSALDAEAQSLAAERKASRAAQSDLEDLENWSNGAPKEQDGAPASSQLDRQKPILSEHWHLYPDEVPDWFLDAMTNGWVFPN